MIYLDYQATTPLAPEARDAMLRWLDGPGGTGFGNPHSPHRMGRQAKAAIEMAREQVAALFPAGGKVIFTSGATEAINLAIRGSGRDGSVSVSAIEHAAVLDTARAAGSCHVLNVAQDGQCNTRQDLPADTRLGLPDAGQQRDRHDPADGGMASQGEAAQCAVFLRRSAGLWPDRGDRRGHDRDFSAQVPRAQGRRGLVGVRDGVGLEEVQTGGGQEFGLRSGTLSPALIAGMGAAAAEAKDRMEQDREHIEMLWDMARGLFADWTLNGSEEARWHGNLNIRRKGLDVNRLMSDVRDVMFSAGSACASGSGRTSHVLEAIGCSKAQAKASIRLGFGRYTTQEEIEQAAARINMAAKEQGL